MEAASCYLALCTEIILGRQLNPRESGLSTIQVQCFHEFEPMDRPPVHELSAVNCHSLRFKCRATTGRPLHIDGARGVVESIDGRSPHPPSYDSREIPLQNPASGGATGKLNSANFHCIDFLQELGRLTFAATRFTPCLIAPYRRQAAGQGIRQDPSRQTGPSVGSGRNGGPALLTTSIAGN
jgi:hypothetical protein